MNTQGIISHRMFVAALSHNETVVAKNSPMTGKLAQPADMGRRPLQPTSSFAGLSPRELMLALVNEQFYPTEA